LTQTNPILDTGAIASRLNADVETVVASAAALSSQPKATIELCRFCDCEMPDPNSLEGAHTVACPRYAEFGQKTKTTSSTHHFSWLAIKGQKLPPVKLEAAGMIASHVDPPITTQWQTLNVIGASPCLSRWKVDAPMVCCMKVRFVAVQIVCLPSVSVAGECSSIGL
jgi:hypothetical protein